MDTVTQLSPGSSIELSSLGASSQILTPNPRIHTIFEKQVELNPLRVAVTFQDKRLTYSQLNFRANQLANYLRKRGVGPDVLVGLYLERSIDLIVGILGILKSGGAYVPLDPRNPSERLEYLLADSNVPLLITQQSLASTISSHDIETVLVDSDRDVIEAEDDSNIASSGNPDDLAYVIYTSGSTGAPKGVMVSHRNVVRLMSSTDHMYGFHREDVWTMFHSHAFDFSVWELWGALLYGGRVVVVPYWISRSPDVFYDLLLSESVTVLNQTPSAFRQLIQVQVKHTSQLPALRYVIFGGEALDPQCLRPWLEMYGDNGPSLINMYGITETTVHVTYRQLTPQDILNGGGSVIGSAIPDLELYVLDEQRNTVAEGQTGELYIGGAGLARGYLNRPELTAERFVENPFSHDEVSRIYRSGDVVRKLKNGELEYLGRSDEQIQIRGFRVEPGEVAAAISKYPGISDAVVMAEIDRTETAQLAAYITASNADILSHRDLLAYLRTKLPEYMLPTRFVLLQSIPLTLNGKINRSELASCSGTVLPFSRSATAPQNTIEHRISEIWKEVLQIENVGRDDNFFDSGGNSLRITELRCKLQAVLSLDISVIDLFQHPTVASIASHLCERTSDQHVCAQSSQVNAFNNINDRITKRNAAVARRKQDRQRTSI